MLRSPPHGAGQLHPAGAAPSQNGSSRRALGACGNGCQEAVAMPLIVVDLPLCTQTPSDRSEVERERDRENEIECELHVVSVCFTVDLYSCRAMLAGEDHSRSKN